MPLVSVFQLQRNTKPLYSLFFSMPICSSPTFILFPILLTPGFPPLRFFFFLLSALWLLTPVAPSLLTGKHQSYPRRLDRNATQHNTLHVDLIPDLHQRKTHSATLSGWQWGHKELPKVINGGMRQALTVSLLTGDKEIRDVSLGRGLCPRGSLHSGLMTTSQHPHCWHRRGITRAGAGRC